MTQKSPYLHQRLHAYSNSLEFYKVVKGIRARLPRGLGPLGDQLSRAAQSVSLNLAEGSAARSRDVKLRHFNIALGSAGECAAALDLVAIEGGAAPEQIVLARSHLRLTTLQTLGLTR